MEHTQLKNEPNKDIVHSILSSRIEGLNHLIQQAQDDKSIVSDVHHVDKLDKLITLFESYKLSLKQALTQSVTYNDYLHKFEESDKEMFIKITEYIDFRIENILNRNMN